MHVYVFLTHVMCIVKISMLYKCSIMNFLSYSVNLPFGINKPWSQFLNIMSFRNISDKINAMIIGDLCQKQSRLYDPDIINTCLSITKLTI